MPATQLRVALGAAVLVTTILVGSPPAQATVIDVNTRGDNFRPLSARRRPWATHILRATVTGTRAAFLTVRSEAYCLQASFRWSSLSCCPVPERRRDHEGEASRRRRGGRRRPH